MRDMTISDSAESCDQRCHPTSRSQNGGFLPACCSKPAGRARCVLLARDVPIPAWRTYLMRSHGTAPAREPRER
eukprot:9239363-Heterocapsa_arctica.AAC.1